MRVMVGDSRSTIIRLSGDYYKPMLGRCKNCKKDLSPKN